MKIAYIGADMGIPVLGTKGALVHLRKFTDALVRWQAVAQQVIVCTLSMEPDAQKNPLLQMVWI